MKPPLTAAQIDRLTVIENEIDRRGHEINALRKEALGMMEGRVGYDARYSMRFKIERAYTAFGGMGGVHLYFKGPRVNISGTLHKSATHSARFSDMFKP